jgi:uncharacterized protein (TIGR02301 family)
MSGSGRRVWFAGLLMAGLAWGPAPAIAQDDGAPLYEPSLLRLSELLGSLHYLRELCGADEGNLWRDQMQALITAENTEFVRRVKLADRFNRGYESYQSVYISCTPSADLTIDRFMNEGALLAGEIAARYGADG